MSNVIPISETPIFKQLAEEYAKRGKRYESLTEGAPVVIREEKLSTSLMTAETFRKQLELYQPIMIRQGNPWTKPMDYQSQVENSVMVQKVVDNMCGGFEKLEEGNLMTERKVSITESFDPYEMFEAGVETDVFVKGVVETFMENHPTARNVVASMTYPENFSPMHTVKVEGLVSVEQAEYVESQTGDQTKE